MQIGKDWKKKTGYGWRRVAILACIGVLAMSYASAAEAWYRLPADRAVEWRANTGVSGDIPNRTTVCATLTPSGGDDTSAIRKAIEHCPSGQVVTLNAGTFNTSSAITVKSGITLRGAGMGKTIVKNTKSVDYVIGFYNNPDASFKRGKSIGVASGSTKGSTSITTASSHGWSSGDLILIDQLEDPDGNPAISSNGGGGRCNWCGRASDGSRPIGQIVKLTSASGSKATFETPLVKNFNKAPQGYKLLGVTSNAGVEDLTIDDSLAEPNRNSGALADYFSDNCWILRVEVTPVYRIGIHPLCAYRNTIRGSKVHRTHVYSGNYGYGIWLEAAVSHTLIEDNILYDLQLAITYNGGATGNVIAYNYVTRTKNENYPGRGWMGIDSHGAFPWMNLFEGNYVEGSQIGGDWYWGGSGYSVYFRNKVAVDPALDVNTLFNIGVDKGNSHYTFIGNVIGTPDTEKRYQTFNQYDGTKEIYFFGDAILPGTTLRHGNWDSANNKIVWNGKDGRKLPASLYLDGKPSWWGAQKWPPIGPEVAGYAASIPARDRYLKEAEKEDAPAAGHR